MEKEHRNALNNAVVKARRLLEKEFHDQLEGTYNILPDGRLLESAPGDPIVLARLLDVIAHHRAGGAAPKEAVESTVREAAFTVLNRFVALKMAERRGLVRECVSQGLQSEGTRELADCAPGVRGALEDGGYRLLLESVMDEISLDLKVLLDRREPMAPLWPRPKALDNLLSVLKADELSDLWSQDETIGWVYQYFNGEDERKAMREASQAPRNSRELAVRNQFFTPRYVVQFLVDNTLGRTWYEMMQGETRLRDLDYLVRRSHEVFLAEGDPVPEESTDEDITEGESPEHPFPVRFRAKKDPRDLRVLDPACGSGHFLLYTFDLLLTIYEEAWQDSGATPQEATGCTLREDYSELDTLRTAVPELILRHNLHGIDIDPRATQIAALALWLRAQRAFEESGLSRAERPAITKTNIVVAEPMPGEKDLRKTFLASLDSKLAKLFERVFDLMALAGEAGYLLRIAEHIEESVREIYGGVGGLFEKVEESEWTQAARDLRTALETFVTDAAAHKAFHHRLFANDAAHGLGFIGVCSQQYDVILMNPPFGECTEGSRHYLQREFGGTYKNIFASFVERALETLSPLGKVGAITSRTFLFLPDFEYLRKICLQAGRRLECCAELGEDVLDNATVRVAATVMRRETSERETWFTRLADLDSDQRAEALSNEVVSLRSAALGESSYVVLPRLFQNLPRTVFAYTTPDYLLRIFSRYPTLQPGFAWVRRVPGTGNNDAVLRLRVEVPVEELAPRGQWCPYAKGGGFAPFYADCGLVISELNTSEIFDPVRNAGLSLLDKPRNSDLFGAPSLTYSYANDFGLDIRPLRAGSLFDSGGPIVFPVNFNSRWAIGAILNSRIVRRLMFVLTPERFKQVGLVQRLPLPSLTKSSLDDFAKRVFQAKADLVSYEEVSPIFAGPLEFAQKGVRASIERTVRVRLETENALWLAFDALDRGAARAYGLSEEEWADVVRDVGFIPTEYDDAGLEDDFDSAFLKIGGREVGKGELTCSYQNTGVLERVCHHLKRNCAAVSRDESVVRNLTEIQAGEYAEALVSWLAGVSFGRWDPRVADGERPSGDSLFSALPACPPAMLQSAEGLPCRAGDEKSIAGGDLPPEIPWDGILVDDPGHPQDIEARVLQTINRVWNMQASRAVQELCRILGVRSLRDYLRRSTGFFARHVKRYTLSQRKAPIYWPLSTPSSSYTVWIYYHRLTADTLFQVVVDYLDPKIRKLQEEQVQVDGRLVGAEGREAAKLAKQAGEVAELEQELGEMKAELLRVAELPYKPNLNDGVQITAAPLSKLFRLPAWRKVLEATWKELEKGEYDWAHLAYAIWPERVREKCKTDISLAIAHGLEDLSELEGAPKKNSTERKRNDA